MIIGLHTTCSLFHDTRTKHFKNLDNSFFNNLDSILNSFYNSSNISSINNDGLNNTVVNNSVYNVSINSNNNNVSNSDLRNDVNWYRIYIFFIGGRMSTLGNDTSNAGNIPNKKEWNNLCKCQLKPGNITDDPFLLRSAAMLNDIMPIAMKRQHILFNFHNQTSQERRC